MTRDELLHAFFGAQDWTPRTLDEHYFDGRARVGGETVTIIGTAGRAEVGADLCLRMAAAVLECVNKRPGEAIVFFLDTQGQRLRRRDELLGLNGYMAHLAKWPIWPNAARSHAAKGIRCCLWCMARRCRAATSLRA